MCVTKISWNHSRVKEEDQLYCLIVHKEKNVVIFDLTIFFFQFGYNKLYFSGFNENQIKPDKANKIKACGLTKMESVSKYQRSPYITKKSKYNNPVYL